MTPLELKLLLNKLQFEAYRNSENFLGVGFEVVYFPPSFAENIDRRDIIEVDMLSRGAEHLFEMGLLGVAFGMTGVEHNKTRPPATLEPNLMGGPDRHRTQAVGPEIARPVQLYPPPIGAPHHGKLHPGERHEPAFARGTRYEPVGIRGTPVR